MWKSKRAVLTLSAMTLAFACSQPTEPRNIAGEYALVNVNSQPLPFVSRNNDTSWTVVRGAGLWVSATGEYSEIRDTYSVCGHYLTFPLTTAIASWNETGGTVTFTGYDTVVASNGQLVLQHADTSFVFALVVSR